MEYYYSGFKKKKFCHATTWMNFEDLMLSESRQSQKDCCTVPLI